MMCQLYVQNPIIPEAFMVSLILEDKNSLSLLLRSQTRYQPQANRFRIFKELQHYHPRLLDLCCREAREAAWFLAIQQKDYVRAVQSLLLNVEQTEQTEMK